ncbi:MAG: HAMP domain-containing protein [Planctomycetes bacterium]|nr:HAMP domain-containing protein [Planctomycetota bacterium]
MRDPLARVPIRWKLMAGFVGLSLAAFAVGAWLVNVEAEGTLREEVVARRSAEARAVALALDRGVLGSLNRARDFASDGLIRAEAERLAADGAAPPPEAAAPLRRHLTENKLPLEPVWTDLLVVAADGRTLARVREATGAAVRDLVERGGAAATEAVGAIDLGAGPGDVPAFAVRTPISSLDRARRVGALVAEVDLARWIDACAPTAWRSEAPGRVLVLDGHGTVVELRPPPDGVGGWSLLRGARAAPAPGTDHLTHAFPVAAAGWEVAVEVDADRALAGVRGLRSRSLGLGLLFAGATALLMSFPLRFLVRPLGRLRDAARRISEGDYGARVEVQSEDEVGELSRAFNGMVDAVRDREGRLDEARREVEARGAELAREHARLDATVQAMQDALVLLDADGAVVLHNAAAAPLLPALTGGTARDLALRCGAGLGEGERDCVGCLGGSTTTPPASCRLEVGSRVYEVLASRLPGDGREAGRLLVARDVTATAAWEERQAQQERLAVLGEVSAIVAHELNNPLSAVALYAQMLEDELPTTSPFREHADVIRRNTETCSRTIRGLLDWAWSATPEVADVDLDDVVDDVVRFLRPLARRARVTLERSGRLRDARLRGDATQLRQVLVNLAMNAVQATEGVGRRVELAVAEADEGRSLVVEVRDDGPGVRPADRLRIFEPFVTTKPAGKGTGLGLPISRRIAEAHGGSLELVAGEPGATVFAVRLPRRAMVASRRPAGTSEESP